MLRNGAHVILSYRMDNDFVLAVQSQIKMGRLSNKIIGIITPWFNNELIGR